ncbi:DUF4149 domain-containing protein [Helicobacter brantae]|uniref:DUF4149 domain-containing protein n=1 Tax=Helicobacter brantae TaxID=375927 RepID=A0A3D8J0Y0_9HELI|nr:DUF4149 domain-containing protein [Helicobacter brantae]RDU71199.1 DUF4149 domain-containing protein [Helicobacter brantae]
MRLLYQFLLASLIGVELTLGVLVAPIIFYPQKVGIETLSLFQSGLLMGRLFEKMGYILLGVSFVSVVFEFFSLPKHFFRFTLSLLIALLSCVFVFYFSDFILHAQSLGENATQTQEFKDIHQWSELTLKSIVALQLLLFFLPFYNRRKYEKVY